MVASGSRTMIAGSLSSCIAGLHQSCTKQNPPRLGGGFREKRDETAGGLRHHHVSVHDRDNYDKRNER